MCRLGSASRGWIPVIVFAWAAVTLTAQAQDRRAALRTPGLILATAAPTAPCYALEFSSDGRHLLAAGADKVIYSWPFAGGDIDRDKLQIFRWAIYREQRGTVHAQALSHDAAQKYVAIGGFGLRNGAISVIDRGTGQVVAGLTAPSQPGVITALAFTTAGDHIIFGTEYGVVNLWNWRQPGNIIKTLGQHPAQGTNRIQAIVLPAPDTAVTVAEDGTLNRWNVQRPETPGQALEALGLSQVPYYVAASGDGQWLAASGPRRTDKTWCVELRRTVGGENRFITLPAGNYPRSLALDRNGRMLAIAAHVRPQQNLPFKPITARVYLYDVAAGTLKTDALPQPTNLVDAVAFAPDAAYLAVAGGDDSEIAIWDLQQRRTTTTITGPGRSLWGVGLSDDGRLLGFRDQRSTDPRSFNDWGIGAWRVFDLQLRNWATALQQSGFQPAAALEASGAWRVEPDLADPYVWYVVDQRTGARSALPLDRQRDQIPRCYTFLPAQPGAPVRLLVGHMWGMSLFELNDNQAPRRTRLFVGHQSDVRSIGFSADAKLIVTASRDQTVAGWTLAPWENERELGATFDLNNGKLTVKAVAPGSPGWEAGLSVGDELRRLAVGGVEVQGGPAAWGPALAQPTPGHELYFEVARPGKDGVLPMLTTVRQRPLWRFFPARDDQWVIWRWRDFFYDASLRGDDLIGWQINKDVDETPDFVRAEQNRQRFHRPDKVEETIRTLSPVPDQVNVPDLVPARVQLTLREAGPDEYEARIEVTDNTLGGPTGPLQEVNLWLNDYKVKRWANVKTPFTETVRFKRDQLRSTPNYIVAQAYGPTGVRADTNQVVLQGIARRDKPQMYSLAVGVNEYRDAPPVSDRGDVWNDLLFARQDAESVFKVTSAQANRGLFSKTGGRLLLDKQVSRQAVLDGIADIAGKVDPDDLMVLFMAGHGWAQPTGNRTRNPNTFCFVTPEFEVKRAPETGVPFTGTPVNDLPLNLESLQDALTKVRCRKLVLLDCCHSGSIVYGSERSKRSNVIRALMPDRIGPVIVAACDKDEQSWDIMFKGHGAFTTALLELQGDKFAQADTNHDGQIAVEELRDYVTKRVPQLIDLARPILAGASRGGLEPGQTQTPQVQIPDAQKGMRVFVQPDAKGPSDQSVSLQ